jgi:hypothetical protein
MEGNMNRQKLNLVALAAVATISCAGIMGSCRSSQQIPSIVKAQRFELVDSSGKTRIAMSMNPETGAAGISLYDAGNPAPRILIGTSSDGNAEISLDDSDGNKRAELSLTSKMVRLSIVAPSLRGGVVLGSSADKTAILFNDDTPAPRAVLGLTPAREPNLTIYDQNKLPIWSTPTQSRKSD